MMGSLVLPALAVRLVALAMRAASPLIEGRRRALANTGPSIAAAEGAPSSFLIFQRWARCLPRPHAAGVYVVFRGEVFGGFFVLDPGLLHPSIGG